VTDLSRALGRLTRRVTRAEIDARAVPAPLALALANIPRTTTVDLSALAVGTTTKTASWTVPVAGDYRVVLQPVIASARLGTIFAGIVAGTKTPVSVDVAVVNSSASVMALGSLDVVIHPA
jgi:hypothetical protein